MLLELPVLRTTDLAFVPGLPPLQDQHPPSVVHLLLGPRRRPSDLLPHTAPLYTAPCRLQPRSHLPPPTRTPPHIANHRPRALSRAPPTFLALLPLPQLIVDSIHDFDLRSWVEHCANTYTDNARQQRADSLSSAPLSFLFLFTFAAIGRPRGPYPLVSSPTSCGRPIARHNRPATQNR